MLKLYNSLSRKKEGFKPLKAKRAGLYSCGPTVYWYAHIGNLRTYIFSDILKRVLERNGYKVKHIINITDVGHLTSDADTGEDKIEKSAKKERKTAKEIARFYAAAFKKDIKNLNIQSPEKWAKATDHIKEQVQLIQKLEKKGLTYIISDGVYFDTSKIADYGKLTGEKPRKLKAGARVEMAKGKKHITDFALWKFSPKNGKRQMEWPSPWGTGFPGWHTECVAMSVKYLGIPFDIHTGGIDHISIHHSNEIAQAKAVFGKKLANFWLHGEFLLLKEGRMGKSEGNIIILDDIAKKGINPLAYRYLCLGTHYRSRMVFSWESLEAAQNGLNHLYKEMAEIKSKSKTQSAKPQFKTKNYRKIFSDYVGDDLNTPKALALLWNLIKDKNVPKGEKYKLLLDFDKVFGFNLARVRTAKIPPKIEKLAKEREKYRSEKNWQKADEIRKEIEKLGYRIEDTGRGAVIEPLSD